MRNQASATSLPKQLFYAFKTVGIPKAKIPEAISLPKSQKRESRFLYFFGIPEAISRRNPSKAESERTFLELGIPKANLIGFHKKVKANESRF